MPGDLTKDIVRRELKAAEESGGGVSAPGVWPPAPKPGPEFGEPSPKIYIGSIPQEYQEDDVRRIFECVGEIKEVKILRRPDDGRHKGSGFVTFADVAATERVIHFINDKYTLIAPNHATQKPIYMKYAKLGGVRPGVPVVPMGYQQPMAYQQPYGHYQQPYGHYPPQQQAYGHYPRSSRRMGTTRRRVRPSSSSNSGSKGSAVRRSERERIMTRNKEYYSQLPSTHSSIYTI